MPRRVRRGVQPRAACGCGAASQTSRGTRAPVRPRRRRRGARRSATADTKSHALGALALRVGRRARLPVGDTPQPRATRTSSTCWSSWPPGSSTTASVLEQRLDAQRRPAPRQRVAARTEVTNAERLGWLRPARPLELRAARSPAGPSTANSVALLAQDGSGPARIAPVEAAVGQLHALSAVVTRTRKVEIQEHKAVREADADPGRTGPIDEADVLPAVRRSGSIDRAVDFGMPVGFATQMPLRLASTCLPAATRPCPRAGGSESRRGLVVDARPRRGSAMLGARLRRPRSSPARQTTRRRRHQVRRASSNA